MRFNLAEFIEIFCNSVKDFREKAFDSIGIELLASDSSVDKIIKNERKSSLILDAIKTYKDQINNDFSRIDTDRWARNDLERAYRMVFEKEVGNKSKGEILINLPLEASSSKEQGKVADDIRELFVKEQFQSDENLRKYLENKMITEDDVNYFRNEAEKWFDLKKNDGRYRGYYYSKDDKEITRITNKFIDSNNEERDLIDIIFESENETTYSVNLFGIGGSGKTFQIFRCIDYILKNK